MTTILVLLIGVLFLLFAIVGLWTGSITTGFYSIRKTVQPFVFYTTIAILMGMGVLLVLESWFGWVL